MGQTPDEGVVVHLEALVTSGEPREIREKAIFALSQHDSERASSVLRGIAESDQFEFAVREKAIFWLGQRKGDDQGAYLRGLYASLTHRELQEKVIFAVSQHRTDADREWLHDLAVDSGEPLALRERAIFWLGQQREDGSELRELYASVTSQSLKEKVIFAVSQQRGDDDLAWLIRLATDDGEPVELREKAIFWAGQMRGDGSELYDLYDGMASESLRERLIFSFSQRKRDPAAVDKLIDIARNESNGELRRKAIFWLGQTRDPRAIDFLSELIGQ
jgi:HEAT repeat protein